MKDSTTDIKISSKNYLLHSKPMLTPQNSEYFENQHCHSELKKKKKKGEYMHS